jgi:RNA polymerase-associated protein RTF1
MHSNKYLRSPGSPGSAGSRDMAQSDSEGDAQGDESDDEAPLYPIEGQFTSQADKTEILSLPEIEREQILAERAANVTRRQQDLQLKRALAATRENARNHNKRKADADLDDGLRKTSKAKTEKRSALDDYKRAREQREAGKSRIDSRRDQRDDRSASYASDRDADGESEVEWAEPSSEYKRDEPPADLRDFNRVHVGRSNFAKVCFYPNFDNAVKGCFARVSIGPDRATGQNVYRMAQIKGMWRAISQSVYTSTNTRTGFTEGKPYKLTTSNGRQFTTDQYALVAHGTAERPWPFLACSDGKFTDAEFDRYLSALDKDNLRAPSRKFINGKLDDIHALLNHNWTDDDIQSKISKQRAMEKKYDPANAANLQREKINKRRAIAQDEDDAEEVAKCDAELAALENQKLNGGSRSQPRDSPAKPKGKQMEHERLQKLNIETRRTNAEEVRKALVEERKKITKAREKAIAEAKAKAEAAAKATASGDLFGEASDISRVGTPANGAPKISRTGTPANGNAGKKGPIGAIKGRSKMDDDVIGSMDLGIDIEI